jgi:sensor c-di-GMP phosphodiesterase-like protein
MSSRRARVIGLAAVLAIAGAIVPLAVMAYASWQFAISKELDALQEIGHRAVGRAEQTYSEAKRALIEIDNSTFERCAASHISTMRILTLNIDSVSEIRYQENGQVKCSSWGRVATRISETPFDYRTSDGLDIAFGIRPIDGIAKKMTALHLGSHTVLVPPSQFSAIGILPKTSLALFTPEGHVFSMRNEVDLEFARSHLGGDTRGLDDGLMFARVVSGDVVAIVSEPVTALYASLQSELMLLLPIGLFISAFIVGIVVFMSRRRLSPRAELELAVQNREFVVHYQPIVELKSNICVGAEALVRWKLPDGSLVRPDLFIPLAEETGLIQPITDQVFEALVRDLGPLLVGNYGLHISVNLCAEDIRTGRFLEMIPAKLQGTGIHTNQIWLEATERGLIDIDAARQTLARAREAGHAVAIDDFGTGYSSLQYLEGLPMDALKIDKSFIDTIGRATATSSVTGHIIGMAKGLGLFTVAEGIETEEQAAYLRDKGVDLGQGWLFSKALAADDFIAFQTLSKQTYGPAPDVLRPAA